MGSSLRLFSGGVGFSQVRALAAAEVGIAMGTGTDVAMESARVTLVKGDLRGIAKAVALSKATMRSIRQNLFFAFVYNALGIPIAAGLLYPLFWAFAQPDHRGRGHESQLSFCHWQRAAASSDATLSGSLTFNKFAPRCFRSAS
jgi:hypothetical protein